MTRSIPLRRLSSFLVFTLLLSAPLLPTGCSRAKPATLAYSGWPTSGGDMARTGHSRYRGPEKVADKRVINVRFQIAEVILGLGDTLYVSGWREGSGGVLAAITSKGDEKWEYRVPRPSGFTGSTAALAPKATAASDGGVFFTSGDRLYSLSSSGGKRWEFAEREPILPAKGREDARKRWLRSSPAIGGDGTVYFGGTDGFVYAIDSGGSKRWEYETKAPALLSTVLEPDGTVLIGADDGYVYALDGGGGLEWRFRTERSVLGLVLENETIIALGAMKPGSGTIYALNEEGRPRWTAEAGTQAYATMLVGRPGLILDSDRIVVFDGEGNPDWTFETDTPAVGTVVDREGTIFRMRKDGVVEVISKDGQEGWVQGLGRSLAGGMLGGDGLLYVWEGSKLTAVSETTIREE